MVKMFFTGSKEKAERIIQLTRSVLLKLPVKVSEHIHRKCMIIFVDDTYGYSVDAERYHLIIINIGQMRQDNLTYKDQELVIAHEFAHFILHHEQSTSENENEANDLLRSWGFLPISK